MIEAVRLKKQKPSSRLSRLSAFRGYLQSNAKAHYWEKGATMSTDLSYLLVPADDMSEIDQLLAEPEEQEQLVQI